MSIKIFKTKISRDEMLVLAKEMYVDMVKGVVDLRQRIVALGGELHADCERVLLEQGSKQENLWGFNIYVDRPQDSRLEYTSMINIRPRQGNLQREVQDPKIRQEIKEIIDEMVTPNA